MKSLSPTRSQMLISLLGAATMTLQIHRKPESTLARTVSCLPQSSHLKSRHKDVTCCSFLACEKLTLRRSEASRAQADANREVPIPHAPPRYECPPLLPPTGRKPQGSKA